MEVRGILMDVRGILVIVMVVAALIIFSNPVEWFADPSSLCTPDYVQTYPGFLTDRECDELVKLMRSRDLFQSEVGGATGGVDMSVRTSKQTWAKEGESPEIDSLYKKVKALLASTGCYPKYDLEDVQLAQYTAGGKYDIHRDGDDCNEACPDSQRIATVLVYLNEPKDGGETDFPLLNMRVKPRKGTAVFFAVADQKTRDLFEATLHAGLPVKKGVKRIANVWVKNKLDR
jgi:prolyl 4-hydroxylase